MDSEEKRRRFLIIGGIVLILIATVFALYFVFFRTRETPNETTPPTFGETSGIREGESQERDKDRKKQEGIFSPVARLRVLSEEPIAGATGFFRNRLSGPEKGPEVVRYLERKTAHVFDITLSDLSKTRISNTTIPRIYESLWTAGGAGVILRYLDDNNETIKTYFARLVEKKDELREGETPYGLEGNFLPDNITGLVLSPNKTNIFWLTKNLKESQGIISDPSGENARTVFVSPFTEWLPDWPIAESLVLTTKASGFADGFAYTVRSSSGEFKRLLGDVRGLTTLTSPDGKYVLYSKGGEKGFSTFIFNAETGQTTKLFINTLVEKCAWTDGDRAYCGVPTKVEEKVFPDSWYQGKIFFTDDIYQITASDGRTSLVYSPLTEDKESIDIYKPFVSESGNYLIFNNKRDMSLWAFTFKEPSENPFGDVVIPDGAGI